jgi:hypothetical protein
MMMLIIRSPCYYDSKRHLIEIINVVMFLIIDLLEPVIDIRAASWKEVIESHVLIVFALSN